MDIEGFYYDESKKKYFRIESGNSGQNRLTAEDVKRKAAIDSVAKYQRSDGSINLPQSLHKQEIDYGLPYNLREQVIRSHLRSVRVMRSNDIEVIDFRGDVMKDVTVDALIGVADNDTLFVAMSGRTGTVVYQIQVKDILSDDYDVNVNKQLINSYPKPNRVIDISYINGSNHHMLSTLTHHFPNRQRIDTSLTLTAITGDQMVHPMSQVYEFPEPIFSATHFEDLNILGAHKKIYVLSPSNSGAIKTINCKNRITAIRSSTTGKLFIAGTNTGQLCCYDIRHNNHCSKRFQLSLTDKSVTYLDILSDSHSVIASSHNDSLCLTDLRMFDKPVLQYSHHRNSCAKIVFSLDESADVLCSAGDDNIVRFWSIKSGKFLHMYSPELMVNGLADFNKNRQTINSHIWYSHSLPSLKSQFKPIILQMSSNRLHSISNDFIDN